MNLNVDIIFSEKWLTVQEKRKIQSFLGLYTHRRFLSGFANIAKSLRKSTEAAARFVWIKFSKKKLRS